jgi:hypothetical protein
VETDTLASNHPMLTHHSFSNLVSGNYKSIYAEFNFRASYKYKKVLPSVVQEQRYNTQHAVRIWL